MEGKGTELKTTLCASGDARGGAESFSLSIDEPPFSTLGPVKKRLSEMTPDQEAWFATWWADYWLHKAKKAAREAFRKQVKTRTRFENVMAATRAQKPEMLAREPAKRPHGATWLNGERWTDETDAEAAPVQKSRDHVTSSLAEASRILAQEAVDDK